MSSSPASADSTADARYPPDCSSIESSRSGLRSIPSRSSGKKSSALTSSMAPARNAAIAAGRAQRASHCSCSSRLTAAWAAGALSRVTRGG